MDVVDGEWVRWFGGLTSVFWVVFEEKNLSGESPGSREDFLKLDECIGDLALSSDTSLP